VSAILTAASSSNAIPAVNFRNIIHPQTVCKS
jgi:hypothetical protein